MKCLGAAVFTLLVFLPALVEPVRDSVAYSTSWAVEIDGGRQEADRIAGAHGFLNRGQIGSLQNHYHFELREDLLCERMPHKTTALLRDDKVWYAEQQIIRSREKRDYIVPPDPGWPKQWSLQNTGQTGGPPGLDSRVEQAWLQGYTGEGVVVTVVDDGVEWNHPDLIDNYDREASYDHTGGDTDPSPDGENSHGTGCAGVVGMSKNSVCGIGVAYESKIGGLKTNLEVSMDVDEASSLSFKQDYIDIYSNSWGPKDNGFSVEGVGPLVNKVFQNGANQGRGGKGSIYVWAAGNGGSHYDSCAADGLVNSIYTIAVGSADQNGGQAYYDEDCSAKMAVTFSYNSNHGDQMYTTTLNRECTDGFTGTSASAPLVSGVIALALQANPDLTWRDVQYLIAYTSNPDILTGDDWVTNAAGLRVSLHFGFGAIDAEAMVTRARHWTNVPEQYCMTIPAESINVHGESSTQILMSFEVSQSEVSSNVVFLEHVVVTLSVAIISSITFNDTDYYIADNDPSIDISQWLQDPHPRRGDIEIELTSPSGTRSVLLPYRDYDFVNEEGYDNWPFMSVHFWGENPNGTWTLKTTYRSDSGSFRVENVSMTLYGTETPHDDTQTEYDSCSRGCTNSQGCAKLRSNSSFECVSTCPNGTTEYRGYCIEGVIMYPPQSEGQSSGHHALVIGVTIFAVVFTGTVLVVTIIVAVLFNRRKRKFPGSNNIVDYNRLEFDDNEELAQV